MIRETKCPVLSAHNQDMCLLTGHGKATSTSYLFPFRGAKVIFIVPVTGNVGFSPVQEMFPSYSWLTTLGKRLAWLQPACKWRSTRQRFPDMTNFTQNIEQLFRDFVQG